jgi:LPXTG-motif cell wall-anchored protein
MTSGTLFFLAFGGLVIAIAFGLVLKRRKSDRNAAAGEPRK